MLNLFLLVMLLWAVGMSIAMTFFTEKLLAHVDKSRMWSWYYKTIFGFTSQTFKSKRTRAFVHIQGVISLIVSVFVLWLFLASPPID